ncbi:MAG: DUF5018 domain-containing protein, partial [Bacteroidota bacterium]
MKRNIFFSIAFILTFISGCKQPDELLPSVAREGINSITASFTDGTGEFTGTIEEGTNEIVIPIPYYFPVSSDNRVTDEMLSNMRVRANLDDNVTVSPPLLFMDLTKDNVITVKDQLGEEHEYIVRGEIRKSSESQIKEFSIPDLGLTGVINES